jgi:hypothetical protein
MKYELDNDTYITIDRVNDYGYIPELKVLGPVSKRMIMVKDVINMINRGADVSIPKQWLEPLYLYIKTYMIYIKTNKLPVVSPANAMVYLENRLYKDSMNEKLEEIKNNPLDDSLDKGDQMKIDKIYSETNYNKSIIQKPKLKKPKLHEIFATNTIESTNREFDEIELNS